MKQKIALLTPRSVLYPGISFDLAAGMRLGLQHCNIDNVDVRTESIGTGGDDKMIYALCEKLLLDGVTVVAGYVNGTTAEILDPLFKMADALFICLDSGFHYRNATTTANNTFYISLESALCCKVVTQIALAEGKRRFAFTTSFYDSGYKSGYSFVNSLEEAGGSITFNHITALERTEFDLTELDNHLKDQQTDAVLASFCGDMLEDFFTVAAKNNMFGTQQLYAGPFMAEEQWLARVPYPGTDVRTCVAWATELDNAENKHFIEILQANNKKANLFSLLGWEAALLIAGSINSNNCKERIELIKNYTYNSPRGEVHIDAATQQTHALIYEAWIQKDEATGNCLLSSLTPSAYTDEERKKLEYDINNFPGYSTKWFNAYGCLES